MVKNFKYVFIILFSTGFIFGYSLDLTAKNKSKSAAKSQEKSSTSSFSETNVKETLEASRSGKKQNSQIETIGDGDKLFLKAKKSTSKNKKNPSQEDYYSVSDKSYSGSDLDKADALAVKTISSINSLLKDKKLLTSSKEFELRLRLGDLYSERHDYLQDKEIREFEQKYDLWVENGSRGKPPVASYKKSTEQLKKSAQAFRTLVTDTRFSKEKRMDSALYALGKSLSRLNDDSSIKYFTRLVTDYPKSNLVPETYLAMGDFYFEKSNPDKALEAYKKVYKYKNNKIYPYAVYKSGWCYFNLNVKSEKEHRTNLKNAVTSFKLVVSLSDKNKNKAGRIDLKSEAMIDLAMVWAELEETSEAERYFKRMKEDRAYYAMIEKLASTYIDQGKYNQAIALYEKILKKPGLNKTEPSTMLLLVSLYEQTGKNASLVKGLEKYSSTYYDKDSKWQQKFRDDKVSSTAVKDYEYSLRKYATTFHKRYQQTNSKQYSLVALNIYGLYLKDFSTNQNAYTMRYYQSELYYDTGAFNQAASGYMAVAEDKNNSKYRQDAYLNTVYSYNELDQRQKTSKLPPLGQVKEPIKIPDTKISLIRSIDIYNSKYPSDKRGYPMMFTAANIYFVHGHYPEAEKRFNNIISTIPNTKQAEISIKILASYYSSQKDWSKLESFARQTRSSKAINQKNIGSYLTANVKLASFYKAQDLEAKKEYSKAATQYKQYQTEFPTDRSADRALYNASICYLNASDIRSSIETQEKLLSSYPKSSVRKNVILNLSQTYESQADYTLAAKRYEMFYREFPQDKRALSSLYNAAILYTGLKEYGKAEGLYKIIYDKTQDTDMKIQAIWQIASIQEKSSKFNEAYKNYQQLSKIEKSADQKLYAEAKALDLNYKHKINNSSSKELLSLKNKLLSNNQVEAYEARNIVSGYLFQNADRNYSDFMSYRVTDIKQLEKQISTKQSKLVKAASSYEEIIKIDDPEYSIASLYALGIMHEEFATTLSNLQFPSDFNKEEVSILKSELKKVSTPLKEESVKFFDLAFTRSAESDTFTPWSKKVYEKMSLINPDKYPEVDELTLDPSFLSFDLDSNIANKL